MTDCHTCKLCAPCMAAARQRYTATNAVDGPECMAEAQPVAMTEPTVRQASHPTGRPPRPTAKTLALIDLLRQVGPMTSIELAQVAQRKHSAVRDALDSCRERGLVQIVDRRWTPNRKTRAAVYGVAAQPALLAT